MINHPLKLPIKKELYENHSEQIETFIKNVRTIHCSYYASDLLDINEKTGPNFEEVIAHTVRILASLQISTDEHIQPVYRGDSKALFKDWKVSKLACIYMLFDGDPDDFEVIARQQNRVIDQMVSMF